MDQLQTINDNQNYLSEPDENGKPRINEAYYKNIILDNINAYLETTQTTRKQLDGNDLLAIFRQTQQAVFAPNSNQGYNNKCNIPYTQYNINTLFNTYVYITTTHKIPPSLFAFSILTGIDEGTLQKYLTPQASEILNFRREMLRNKLFDDRVGRVVLANNDSSFGLEYERKNTVERETIKRGLSLGELPKLD